MAEKNDYLIDEEESCLYLLGDVVRKLNSAIFMLYRQAFNKNLGLRDISTIGAYSLIEINKLFYEIIDKFFDDETKEYLMKYIETERNIIKLKIDEM